jgi:hypothetical protein
MSLTRLGEGQDCPDMRPQLSTIEEASDVLQSLARDIDQKEDGFDAVAFCDLLIRTGHCRNQFAASTKNLERALLCFAADQIDDSVRVANLFLKALGSVVHNGLCAEVAHGGKVVPRGRRNRFQARVTGELNRIRPDVSRRSMNDHCLASLEVGVIEQGLPSRHGNDRNGGSFDVG